MQSSLKAIFSTVLFWALSCTSPKISQEERLCQDVSESAKCTDDALSAAGGHFKIVCSPKNIMQACSIADREILRERMDCLRKANYCSRTNAFAKAAQDIKSRVSVDKYTDAATALNNCIKGDMSESCQKEFAEDIYNPFDLPNSKPSLSSGLVGRRLERAAPAYGTKGKQICHAMKASGAAACANNMMQIAGGHFLLTCNAANVDQSCNATEQERILDAIACLEKEHFCELASKYLDEAFKDRLTAEPSYQTAMKALEKCTTIDMSKLCQTSFNQDILNPHSSPNDSENR